MTNSLCFNDMGREDLMEVNGGVHPILVAAAAVTACVVVFNACETAGESIGRAIYYATH